MRVLSPRPYARFANTRSRFSKSRRKIIERTRVKTERAANIIEFTPRHWEIFFELFEGLPRQGPGNRANAEKALALCRNLPPEPAVLDLGCGSGGQTLHLAELTAGTIVAVDAHAPLIERLRRTVESRGLSERVRPLVAPMEHTGLMPESFDLVWSEGAFYNIGIDNALRVCRSLLKLGGHVVFSDAVWRKDDPPPEVRETFDCDYPAMGSTPDVIALIETSGFDLLGHFTLPDEAWWNDFYTPMEKAIGQLREKYAADAEALAILESLAREPEMHRDHSDYYAYEFFAARRV